MQRRFLSRGNRRGSSFRNAAMRVWVAAVPNGQITVANTNTVFVIADPAGFATTPGNTKHVGTLVRIRGEISFLGDSTQSTVFWGIIKRDIGEATQIVASVAFGQDEEVLAWGMFRNPSTSQQGPNTTLKIDVKAKRRFDVESELILVFASISVAPVVTIVGTVRSLWLVP